MSTVTVKTKSALPPPAAKGKKRKLQQASVAIPNSFLVDKLAGKPSKAKRTRESSKTIKKQTVEIMPPKEEGGGPLICKDKDGKKAKKGNSSASDEGHIPRSSFRLYLRRQNKSHEMKKRAEPYVRTVELIKRPIELRDPATKILFLASLGLYPASASGEAPIVLVKQSSSNFDQSNDSSESSESAEKDAPIIEVVSDQDQETESVSPNTGDSFSISDFCLGLKTKKVISSTPNVKRRKRNNPKAKANGTKSTSIAKRKPLVQRQHNSISVKATVTSTVVENAPNQEEDWIAWKPEISHPGAPNVVENTPMEVNDWRPFKCELPQPDIIQCVQSQMPEIKAEIEHDKFANLESIKRMLAKLHTHIAPAEEQIQLITIE